MDVAAWDRIVAECDNDARWALRKWDEYVSEKPALAIEHSSEPGAESLTEHGWVVLIENTIRMGTMIQSATDEYVGMLG